MGEMHRQTRQLYYNDYVLITQCLDQNQAVMISAAHFKRLNPFRWKRNVT